MAEKAFFTRLGAIGGAAGLETVVMHGLDVYARSATKGQFIDLDLHSAFDGASFFGFALFTLLGPLWVGAVLGGLGGRMIDEARSR